MGLNSVLSVGYCSIDIFTKVRRKQDGHERNTAIHNTLALQIARGLLPFPIPFVDVSMMCGACRFSELQISFHYTITYNTQQAPTTGTIGQFCEPDSTPYYNWMERGESGTVPSYSSCFCNRNPAQQSNISATPFYHPRIRHQYSKNIQ